jgi:hypothetical protein
LKKTPKVASNSEPFIADAASIAGATNSVYVHLLPVADGEGADQLLDPDADRQQVQQAARGSPLTKTSQSRR